ncbi:MAG: SAM-dependent methyltransferase [Thermomicrobiales bacterium]|nr:SAM-dependent methyltransferase [Thermomicrobiales bacterium]
MVRSSSRACGATRDERDNRLNETTNWFDDTAPDPDRLAESVAPLVERLRERIAEAGPITFAEFMGTALYDGEHGYYRRHERRPGRGGDFLTAPEATPLFGITLARQIAECWERLGSPERFTIREYGAGIGGLAYDILAGLSDASPEAFAASDYRLVDVNDAQLAGALDAMAEVGLGAKVSAELADGQPLEPITGVVLANEVADAIPAHRFIQTEDGVREMLVGWRDGWFVDVEGSVSEAAAAPLQAVLEEVAFSPGDRFEVSPQAGAWFAEAAKGLERGYALIIDYGYPVAELYAPSRRAGLIRGYFEHTVTDEPYRRVGSQDLTTHVDFTALERAGMTAGLTLAGLTTQADLLAALGLGEFLVAMQRDSEMTLEQYLATQAAVLRLIDPGGLGRFRVLAMARNAPVEPPLRGFEPPKGIF